MNLELNAIYAAALTGKELSFIYSFKKVSDDKYVIELGEYYDSEVWISKVTLMPEDYTYAPNMGREWMNS